jgi:hypothetical protein
MTAQQIINSATDSGVIHGRVKLHLCFYANRGVVLVFEQRTHSGSYLPTKLPNLPCSNLPDVGVGLSISDGNNLESISLVQ